MDICDDSALGGKDEINDKRSCNRFLDLATLR